MKQKIVSLSLSSVPQGLPQHFIVGKQPLFKFNDDGTFAGNEVPDSPSVSKITLPLIDLPKRVYPGQCYIIHFENSDLHRIIPAKTVADVGYMSTVKSTTDPGPELPEG